MQTTPRSHFSHQVAMLLLKSAFHCVLLILKGKLVTKNTLCNFCVDFLRIFKVRFTVTTLGIFVLFTKLQSLHSFSICYSI